MLWDQQLFVDIQVLFGLRSAPKIFKALVDVAEWILQQERVQATMHCLDDFLLIGAPATAECGVQLSILPGTFDRLGLPVAPQKLERPAVSLIFLGIELDAGAIVMCPPPMKLSDLRQLIREWRGVPAPDQKLSMRPLQGVCSMHAK